MDDWDDESIYYDDESLYDDGSMDSDGAMGSKCFRVLKKDDIQKHQEDDITLLSSSLSISTSAAAILLHKFAWNVDKAQDAWFNDGNGVRQCVGGGGLQNKPAAGSGKSRKKLVCGICFENYFFDRRFNSIVDFCGHGFCTACLKNYVSIAIKDGPRCLFLRCPEPSCRAVIGEDMINLLACDTSKVKYKEYYFKAYVENNKNIKWCPAPDCKYAIWYELGSESYDVTCDCSLSFCWNCAEEIHRPVECKTVAEWLLKNSSESENVIWILANSKPCPKCKVAIEKNEGCMHMTCKSPCGYQFCWLCLGPWGHVRTSACNGYTEIVQSKEQQSKEEREREKAKRYNMRYAHYYERWAANHKSREKALSDLNVIKTSKLQQLEEKHCQTAGQLKFVTEAWEQIVECRRVLKWTYSYGFYLPDEATSKTKLFEYLQGEAEAALERLHDYAENKIKKYFEHDGLANEFVTVFRIELINMTRITRNYFENFVKGMANDFSEAANHPLEPEKKSP